ncbi:MAG: carbohydrate porin [Chromatiales bacterium]|jgi:hypothetical protein
MNNQKIGPGTSALSLGLALALAAPGASAAISDEMAEQLIREVQALKQRVDQLEGELERTRQQTEERIAEQEEVMTRKAEQIYEERADEEDDQGIKVGGAVRFQYSNEDYVAGNRNRGGDLDLDTVRVNMDGSIGDVILSAEYRFYQYMDVIHHAWVGYDFTDSFQGQVGIHQVPFGVLPYNSHNFFFSTNYYVGLEDDYDFGVKGIYEEGPLNVQLAFYKNDEQGGVDGFVDNRSDRYSYDVVGFRAKTLPGAALGAAASAIGAGTSIFGKSGVLAGLLGSFVTEGTFASPRFAIAESNTFNARVAYTLRHGDDASTELGLSGQYGDLTDGSESVGDHLAYAAHLVGNYGRWNLQLQAAKYEYNLDNAYRLIDSDGNRIPDTLWVPNQDLMSVGAYSFFDTIPAEATTYTANLAYSLPVDFGPISNLTFYNDYSLMTDKSGGLPDTVMNVTGMAVTAGGLYTYFDWVNAKNQPFIGGTLAGQDSDWNSRFNINVGYYF